MAGFNSDVLYATNVDFTGSTTPVGKVTADGQLLIGSAVAPFLRVATLTAGPGISIANAAGAITVSLTGGGIGIDSFQPDSGTNPVLPNGAGLVVMAGSGSITTVGSVGTLTTQLTGLTRHAVLIGAGTSTITNVGPVASTGCVLVSNGVGSDPGFSTATYPLTTTVSQILYSSASNTVTGLATANRGVLTTGTTGIPVITALATDGQLIIGSTAGVPAAANISAGVGITITNASNAITIATAGGGVTWTIITIDQTAAVNNGYICNKGSALLLALPATAIAGDIIRVTGINTALGWKITQAANQQIFFGTASTTLGATGFLQSSAIRDSVELVCVVAGASTIWNCISSVGSLTAS